MNTICGIATAAGNAGVAIIRISGENSLDVLKAVLCTQQNFTPRYMYLKDIQDEGIFLDKCLCVYFKAPHSYTGEDVCEIHCHGGLVVTREILGLCIKNGAHIAQPGEFTKRAFLNGKIDLSQAESVMDLISSMSRQSAKNSARGLKGELKEKIMLLQDSLTDIIASIEAGIEYPEEDIEIAEDVSVKIKPLIEEINALIKSYDTGRIIKEGLRIAIAGRPNVGKSSILNALIGEEKAIVTHIEGTTRDIVSEQYMLGSTPVVFMDTAGIRKTSDVVEAIGVSRSRQAIEQSDITLFVIDKSAGITKDDEEIFKELTGEVITVLNKDDKSGVSEDLVKKRFGSCISISALEKQGIDALLKALGTKVEFSEALLEGIVITTKRHLNSLINAKNSLEDALMAIESNSVLDCICVDIKDAWDSLGEITGVTLTEDIVDRIFTKFCLGK